MQIKLNRFLTILFAALCAINFGFLVVGFLSIPRYYQRTTTLTVPYIDIPYANVPTNQSLQQGAAEHGMTLAQFAIEQIAFNSAVVLIFMAVAGVIIFRAGWNWFAWYSAFFLIFISESHFYDQIYVAALLPIWLKAASDLFWPLILLYIFLFPNGKMVPRKAGWGVGSFLLFHLYVQTGGFLSLFFPNLIGKSFWDMILGPAQYLIYVVFLFILGCQVYRYRKVSTLEEKLQTRWFLFGLAFFMMLSLVSAVFGSHNPYRGEVSRVIFLFVPISVGFAILRYRLWDIDLVIRRTLQYGLHSGLLGLVYFGGVVLLRQVLGGLAGDSNIAIVLSTLLVAALFEPVRRRVQAFIDRRFYRRSYDTAAALERFSQNLRERVDLPFIESQLVDVVSQTIQPTHASLWVQEVKTK